MLPPARGKKYATAKLYDQRGRGKQQITGGDNCFLIGNDGRVDLISKQFKLPVNNTREQ